jgi:hypothetical protein
MFERVFKGDLLDKVKQDAVNYINTKIDDGYSLIKVAFAKHDAEFVLTVKMSGVAKRDT